MAKISIKGGKMSSVSSKQVKSSVLSETSSKPPSPFAPKKTYKKGNTEEFGSSNFGQTGLTGRS